MARSFIPRPEMASKIADMLSPDPLFGEISGLFLAAPRRTGKSTFLRRDLKPMLEERGQVVLYVDLWADRSVDPAELMGWIPPPDGIAMCQGDVGHITDRRKHPWNKLPSLG